MRLRTAIKIQSRKHLVNYSPDQLRRSRAICRSGTRRWIHGLSPLLPAVDQFAMSLKGMIAAMNAMRLSVPAVILAYANNSNYEGPRQEKKP